MAGAQGKHINLDTYVTSSPPQAPTGIGYLVPPPKQINGGDAKTGPKKNGVGRINPDTYSE
jgi:hypothetical protein